MVTPSTLMKIPLSTKLRAKAMAVKLADGNLTAYTIRALESAIKRDERKAKKCD